MILNLKAKHSDYPVYARNSSEQGRAYLYLFNLLDEYGCYGDLDEDLVGWYTKAKQGDAQAACWLMSCRNDHQYEKIEIIYPLEP